MEMSDDNIVSLGALRFYQQGTTKDAKPEDVLDAARAFVRETGCDHIIICCGRTTEDGGSGTRFFQGGEYTYHGQQGLLYAVQDMLRENG